MDFEDTLKVLSFSELFLSCVLMFLCAVMVKCKFISSGKMSFTVDDCFGTDLFVSWLTALQTDLQGFFF